MLVVNPVIHAELSLTVSTAEALDRTLASMELPLQETPRLALFLASKAFALYRRYAAYFPTVRLVHP